MARRTAKTDGDSKKTFEKAVFTLDRPRDLRGRWTVFLAALLLQAAFYLALRDVVYTRLVHDFAQRTFNNLSTASIERLERVEVDWQGDVIMHDAEAWTEHDGVRRRFFRTRRLRLALDGMPLRDESLHVTRVDLFQPEIWIRRDPGGDWNVLWAFQSATPEPRGAPAGPETPEDPWAEATHEVDSFPRNGVHVYNGTIHVTLVTPSGKEVTWRIRRAYGELSKVDGVYRLKPFEGEFYGGEIVADAEILGMRPFRVRQFTVDVRDADVRLMTRNVQFIRHRMTGTFNGVLALTYDAERTGSHPIAAGRCEITDGDLYPLPAFSGIVHLLALTPVEDKRIDTGVLEFTVEEDRIRIDKMHFLGYPVSLFGEGSCAVTGEWIDVYFIPTLGKKTWNDILPVIGAPLDLLSNIIKGALVPVTLTGSFSDPVFKVGEEEAEYTPDPKIRKLIEEKAPK